MARAPAQHCRKRWLPSIALSRTARPQAPREGDAADGPAAGAATSGWSTSRSKDLLTAEELDTDNMKLASMLLAEKRQRQREAMLAKPMGVHSSLRVHDIKPVDAKSVRSRPS